MDDKNIYVTKPFLPPLEEFIPYLRRIWDNRILTNGGEFHHKLETELSKYLGVKYVSLFCNGTLALVTALQALEISGEVITTPFSFVATSHSLWWNNIKPVFVDIEPDTFNLNPSKIERAITSKTTAILPVHVYGNPCDVNEIKRISDKYGLKIIYDACHAFGVKKNGESILNFGDLSVLSFHATKVFNTFEGGAIICHDEETKRKIDFLKNFGFAGETTVVSPGINAKMNEFQASLGLLQLKYFKKILSKRKIIADRYRESLKNISGIRFIEDIQGIEHSYAYFPILIEDDFPAKRDEIYDYLKRHGIYTRRYFYPLISDFPFYRDLESSRKENLPVADFISERIICLPIYYDLTKENLFKICEKLKTYKR